MSDRPEWEEDAIQQVIDASRPMILKTKTEIIAYFKGKYPGKTTLKNGKVLEKWKPELAKALQPFAFGKNGQQQKLAYIERRFQAGRETSKATKKQQEEYAALGKALGAIGRKPPENGYHVHFEGWIRFSECVERKFDIDIVGKFAAEVCKMPELVIDIILRIWLDQENEDEASAGICQEGEKDEFNNEVKDPEIKITANPDDKRVEDTRKRHKSAKPKGFSPFAKKK